MGHGKKTAHMILQLCRLDAGKTTRTAKPAERIVGNKNPYAAISDVVDHEENLENLAELPFQGMYAAHLLRYFKLKLKRSDDSLAIRKYLHAIRVYYGYDTAVAYGYAKRNWWPSDKKFAHLPNLWSDGQVWFIKKGKLTSIEVGKKNGKIGMFGF